MAIRKTIHIIEARPERRYERQHSNRAGRQTRRDRLVAVSLIALLLIGLYLALGPGKRRAGRAAQAARVIESFERGYASGARAVAPPIQRGEQAQTTVSD
jgi:hypothetical protein